MQQRVSSSGLVLNSLGGAGNIEAVSLNEKKKENREQYELGQVQTNLNDSNAMPREPTERPILRVD